MTAPTGSQLVGHSGKYLSFLSTKRAVVPPVGINVPATAVNPALFPHQRDLTGWALRKGRAAIFADCGLGKTFMQLEWAAHIPGRVLILAPLAVAQQTVAEAKKLGQTAGMVAYARSQSEAHSQIVVTNYEMAEHFDPRQFEGVVLDESSILKSIDGKTKERLIAMFAATPYRLCCTATPAPNDTAEFANHAEFLGICSREEMLAMYFVHDDEGWRLKGHAREPFFRWLASWGMSLAKPSDLGYSDDGYVLPPLSIIPEIVHTDFVPEGQMFATDLKGVSHRSQVRRGTIEARVQRAVELVHNESSWYYLRDEHSPERPALHQGVPTSEPGQVAENARAAGEGQRSKARTLRARRITADSGAGSSQAVAGVQPGQEERPEASEARDHCGAVSGAFDSTERSLRDLRALGSECAELLPAGGSLPQDGAGAGAALYELQSGAGEVSGRSESAYGGRKLPQWVIWCGLNGEQDALVQAFGDDCVSVDGRVSLDEKVARLGRWLRGEVPILISKPKVAGFGMNFQNAARQVFVGLSDSYEAYYQCIRRSWRFGQSQPVNAHIVLSDLEQPIYDNVLRKEREAHDAQAALVRNSAQYERAEIEHMTTGDDYVTADREGLGWKLMLGDCVERIREIPNDSIDFSVFSPPFASLYTYSNSDRDMGNSASFEEFFEHYGYLIGELLRVVKPGRNVAVHCQQLSTTLSTHGVIGLRDFRGELIRAHVAKGFVYHGEVCIDKDPQAQAIRTHSKALLFVQLRKDSSWLRPAMADYILVFRKPGENAVPIQPDISNDDWIEWARPIWYGIRESETLNAAVARGDKDERHICPLQLETIERCIRLWSNKGETVLSPFAGIGSELYVALKHDRKAVGIELKPEYFEVAVRNIETARDQGVLL